MSKAARKELLEVYVPEYRIAPNVEKRRILDSFTAATGYSRKHAIALLNGQATVSGGTRPGRLPKLGAGETELLIQAWHLAGRICAKRLQPFLPVVLEELEKGGTTVDAGYRQTLSSISAATIDRVLVQERRKHGRSLCTTKRAALVKNKVPIRTFTEWNDVLPGFFEIDTISHCASDPGGRFVSTLNMTDIATCWTEMVALPRKSALEVIRALETVKKRLPFAMKGIDFDNGSEFLNEALIGWCDRLHINYTRSREYKKNDQAWIEEKNGSVVRKHVGRSRFESSTEKLLNEFYSVLRLYINFFQPCQKLLSKERTGAKTYKKHDVARTPYQRVLDSPNVTEQVKLALIGQKETLSMVELKARMTELQTQLAKVAVNVTPLHAAVQAQQRMAVYEFVNQTKTTKTQLEGRKGTVEFTRRFREILAELEPGTILTARDFLWLGHRNTIDKCLHRLAKVQILKRVGCGLYQVNAIEASAALPMPPFRNSTDSQVAVLHEF